MRKISSPLKRIISGIDNMTIAKKTTLLFVNMVVGMLFLGSFAHLSLNRIKGDFDILYDKRMVPIIGLEKIKDIYTVNILDTLRDVESNHISKVDGRSIILLAQELIRREWSEYKSSLMIEETSRVFSVYLPIRGSEIPEIAPELSLEDDMIEAIEKKIRQIDSILVDIFNLFGRNHSQEAFSRLQEDLYPSVNSINIHLTQLISLNLEAANIAKLKTEAVYRNTFAWIVAATVGTILVATLLAIIILRNIRRLHAQMTKMVHKKTKELQSLNIALEEKIVIEVEQSRQKDQIMFRQSRLAAMGEMVGNIAHQWRQPLNAIVLVIQSIQMKKMVGKLDDEFIDSQVDEGMRLATSMSRTIDDFRDFFKPNKKEEIFSVKKVLEESMDLVKSYYDHLDIKISLVCEEDFEVLGYPNEFSQVIMNLFSNSKDSLNEKENQKKYIEVVLEILKSGAEGKISVIDNAGGVPVEVIDRIFDPYFTTKHQSSGTGIGLHMSKEIIEKQMNGSIDAQNISHKFLDNDEVYEKCACIRVVMPINKEENKWT